MPYQMPEVNGLSYNPTSGIVWAACGDWKTRGYDVNTGRLMNCLEGHKDYVHQVAVKLVIIAIYSMECLVYEEVILEFEIND